MSSYFVISIILAPVYYFFLWFWYVDDMFTVKDETLWVRLLWVGLVLGGPVVLSLWAFVLILAAVALVCYGVYRFSRALIDVVRGGA